MHWLPVVAVAAVASYLAVGCSLKDNPPNAPAVPVGPTLTYTDWPTYYVCSDTDTDGDSVYLGLNFVFEDGHANEGIVWSKLVGSGDTVGVRQNWYYAGTYQLRACALDEHGYRSDWSPSLTVKVEADTFTRGTEMKEEAK